MAINEITINGVTQMTVRDTTALAADVDSSKYFYGADGVRTAGTGSGGGGAVSVPRKAVNFIDYDGTVLYAYTAAEFAALDAMPANPTHSGLTAQGWNWTLANAKTYVQKYGALDIGQMYITADGKTHIDIVLGNPDLLSPYLKLYVNGTVTIDWGDSSALDTVTGTSLTTAIYTQHVYAATGAYTIKISVVSGELRFHNGYILTAVTALANNANRRYNGSVVAVRLGSGMTEIGYQAFANCYAMRTVTIPSSIINIGSQVFSTCVSLAALVIPISVTSIEIQTIYLCYSLWALSLPAGVTTIGNNGVYACYNLNAVAIPSDVTSLGSASLQNNYFLNNLTIPESVTSIGANAFNNCHSLLFIRFGPTTPPTVANSNAFSNLPTDCKIYVPSGTLADYTTETNYPSSGTYTYVEY